MVYLSFSVYLLYEIIPNYANGKMSSVLNPCYSHCLQHSPRMFVYEQLLENI